MTVSPDPYAPRSRRVRIRPSRSEPIARKMAGVRGELQRANARPPAFLDRPDRLLEAALGEYSDRSPFYAVGGLEVAHSCANAVAHIARCRTSHIHRIVRSGRRSLSMGCNRIG